MSKVIMKSYVHYPRPIQHKILIELCVIRDNNFTCHVANTSYNLYYCINRRYMFKLICTLLFICCNCFFLCYMFCGKLVKIYLEVVPPEIPDMYEQRNV